MPLVVGVPLALAVGLFATVVGLDRDRAFYPTVTIVIAYLYALFAVIASSTDALVLEVLAGTVFMVGAVLGFRYSLLFAAVALAAHGIFDVVHAHIITNPGVPSFWPQFCGAYDVVAGGYLAWLLSRGRIPATAPWRPSGNPA